MSKHTFSPDKPFTVPLPGENLVSYGDRLLWHQLGLQMNDHPKQMLTESEYVDVVMGYYPEANRNNVARYSSYFNSKQNTMGFHDNENEMPIPVKFQSEE